MTEEELDMIIFQSHGKEEKALLQLRAERDALKQAILWALGEGEEFPLPPETVRGQPKFWWRKDLRLMLDAALRGEGE